MHRHRESGAARKDILSTSLLEGYPSRLSRIKTSVSLAVAPRAELPLLELAKCLFSSDTAILFPGAGASQKRRGEPSTAHNCHPIEAPYSRCCTRGCEGSAGARRHSQDKPAASGTRANRACRCDGRGGHSSGCGFLLSLGEAEVTVVVRLESRTRGLLGRKSTGVALRPELLSQP